MNSNSFEVCKLDISWPADGLQVFCERHVFLWRGQQPLSCLWHAFGKLDRRRCKSGLGFAIKSAQVLEGSCIHMRENYELNKLWSINRRKKSDSSMR